LGADWGLQSDVVTNLGLQASAAGGITVEASSPGLGSATLVIPTSTDPADAPLEAARQSIGAGYIGG